MKPTFFRTIEQLHNWFARNHDKVTEFYIGYYKKESGKGGVVYKEALDEALCWGWIDGRVNRIDEHSYQQRWTPRKAGSYWSQVNIRKANALIEAGRMQPPGMAAFERRDRGGKNRYSFENDQAELPAPYLKRLKANKAAWTWLQAMRPSYRKAAFYWLMTAKQDATRERRLQQLIECSAEGRYIPPFRVSTNTDKDGRPLAPVKGAAPKKTSPGKGTAAKTRRAR